MKKKVKEIEKAKAPEEVEGNGEGEGDTSSDFGDSKFLAMRDKSIQVLRENEKNTNRKLIEKMLTLRHNMKYNKHLVSVYMKAKELFDQMVEEHRLQIASLDEIYRHLNQLIRENLSKQRTQKKNNGVSTEMMNELVNDKKRISTLLKKMRESYEKLMNVDTVIGVTVQKINELTTMDDYDDLNKMTDSEDDEGEEYDDTVEDEEDEYEHAEDEEDENLENHEESEYDEDDEESEYDEDDEDDEESEDDEDDEDDEESEDEDDEESEDEDDEESEDDEDDEESEDEDDESSGKESKDPRVIYMF